MTVITVYNPEIVKNGRLYVKFLIYYIPLFRFYILLNLFIDNGEFRVQSSIKEKRKEISTRSGPTF